MLRCADGPASGAAFSASSAPVHLWIRKTQSGWQRSEPGSAAEGVYCYTLSSGIGQQFVPTRPQRGVQRVAAWYRFVEEAVEP
jgi:hypothetical protein